MNQRKSNVVDTIAFVALFLFLAVACFGGFAYWQYSRVRAVQAEMLELEAMKAHEQAVQAKLAAEKAAKKAAEEAGQVAEEVSDDFEAEQEIDSDEPMESERVSDSEPAQSL